MSDRILSLENVSLRFQPVEVFTSLSIDILRGEFVAVVGPSGCGKTTLLNLLSGHLEPLDGKVTRLGRARMVYQDDGLLPWLTVTQNIELGLREVKDDEERKVQVQELVTLIGLNGFDEHYPHQLSGGMRRRVELARALAGETDILLLDEPFASLDYFTRLRLRKELAQLLHQRPRTVVLVTHDIEEAAQLADRVVVLSERPAEIRCELRLQGPRPRDLTHPEVIDTIRIVLNELSIGRER
jgi:ABC-type nitrate/sulfonate/bicarbonate transport system ATPase subunit